MPRLALLNMSVGFFVVFFAAAFGAFIANEIAEAYIHDPKIMAGWLHLLQRSSHGHLNLFGMLHVCFGLTLPYSCLSERAKLWQTLGIFMGVIAMGPIMLIRGLTPPMPDSISMSEVLIGGLLSASLLAILSHAVGLLLKIRK